jgi:hypothetical protein
MIYICNARQQPLSKQLYDQLSLGKDSLNHGRYWPIGETVRPKTVE